MKIINPFGKTLVTIGFACVVAAGGMAGTFKNITVDGDSSDWVGVVPAYVNENGVNNPTGVDFQEVYLANDADFLYIRFTLQQPADPISAWNTYIWLDNDNSSATGFHPFGNPNFGSSLMIINDQAYQQAGGGWNEGTLTTAGAAYGASAIPGTDFEFKIARNVTGVAGDFAGLPLLNGDQIGVQLASETGTADSLPAWANYGTLTYTFATAPVVLTTNLPLITLTDTIWLVNASGTDLGLAWLDQGYDDTQSPWNAGNGLFGYTPAPGTYPTLNTPLSSSGPNTYYFRAHFSWDNLAANVAFVVTNYLTDGAVIYLNGVEVRRVRMPASAVGFATSATGTNSPLGQAEVFGIAAGPLVVGDNILEVETHQAVSSSADMVFGLSLTAAAQFPVIIVDPQLPADQTVAAGQLVTFAADVIGNGPLSYQWLKNGDPVAGATNAVLTIPQVLTNDAGNYFLSVSNALGTNLTRAALLVVTTTPVVISDPAQPADTYAVEGQPVTLSVATAGSPLLQYQWFKNNSAIPDATNANYLLPFSAQTNSGSYRAAVINPAGATNSRTAVLTVLPDRIPPAIAEVVASASQIIVTFSAPVAAATANNTSHFSLSGGLTVSSAVLNPGDATQVILTPSAPLIMGVVYQLTVNGVTDLFGNAAHTTAAFTRTISIDGNFDDWQGVVPSYSGPIGAAGAADFKDIYLLSDASHYYFCVTLWQDIPPGDGQFPAYVNMFFDTDNDGGTGYAPVGSELLIQSGYSYQEKNGGFNEGGINDLNWICWPAATGTNFEFSVSRAATFASDGVPVFPTNVLNFLFQGMTPAFVTLNAAPASGVVSFTNTPPAIFPSLPSSLIGVERLANGAVAVDWDLPGMLQARGSLNSGVWTNVVDATPPTVIPAAGTQLFFRVMK
ncbi:MAG: Ig-like domain-containing protein [Verrucomicrobia subdivision 3 bacterium]|nr:Ig-like domain-containing protein [Limisphaerales bacterium]